MSSFRAAPAAMILATAVALSACASLGGGRQDTCRSTLAPDPRGLEEVLDSATLAREVDALWRPDLTLVLATLAYDSVGALDTAEVMADRMPDDVRGGLTRTLTSAAPAGSTPEDRIHLFIGDASGPRPRRVTRFRGCAPVMLDTDHLGRLLMTEGQILGIRRPVTVRLAVWVEDDGHVGEVRVDGTSGDATVDEAATRVMRRATFLPARVEDIPVAVWAAFPITFRPPGRSSR